MDNPLYPYPHRKPQPNPLILTRQWKVIKDIPKEKLQHMISHHLGKPNNFKKIFWADFWLSRSKFNVEKISKFESFHIKERSFEPEKWSHAALTASSLKNFYKIQYRVTTPVIPRNLQCLRYEGKASLLEITIEINDLDVKSKLFENFMKWWCLQSNLVSKSIS